MKLQFLHIKRAYQQFLFRRHIRRFVQDVIKKGGTIVCVDLPNKRRIKNLSQDEKNRADNWFFDFNNIHKEANRICALYPKQSLEYIESLYEGIFVYDNGKRKVLKDYYSRNVNIVEGLRRTTDQPARYSHTIYILGACTMRGTGVHDRDTVASILQRAVNDKFPNSYRVINLAIGMGSNFNDDIAALQEHPFEEGDIVVWGIYGKMSDIGKDRLCRMGCYYTDTTEAIEKRDLSKPWFTDNTLHTTAVGNEMIGGVAFNALIANKLIHNCKGNKMNTAITSGSNVDTKNPAFQRYLSELSFYKRPAVQNKSNGCIVMNCNPFTNGHLFLIEHAAKQVGTLYIFVVEENKSVFPFEDRKKLVEQGTSHLQNVVVIGSGQFIISAVTFPGYFLKDHIKEATIDCSNDLSLFARHIAPLLDIKIRFAGEEPLDPITNQYNDAMRSILPQYGIEFREIKRIEKSGGVISASRVRKCIQEHRIEEIRDLVPPTTFAYLEKHFNK